MSAQLVVLIANFFVILVLAIWFEKPFIDWLDRKDKN